MTSPKDGMPRIQMETTMAVLGHHGRYPDLLHCHNRETYHSHESRRTSATQPSGDSLFWVLRLDTFPNFIKTRSSWLAIHALPGGRYLVI